MSTLFSIGQMNQLGDALEVAGYTPDDVTKLRAFPRLREIRDVLRGSAEIVIKYIIDLDADPCIPAGLIAIVEEHRKGGKWEWDSTKVKLHVSSGQKERRVVEGHQLREELAKEPVFNANVLDYLLAHPYLIPEDWKGYSAVVFWGTIYRGISGRFFVRCLFWGGSSWRRHYDQIGVRWGNSYPAAVLASS